MIEKTQTSGKEKAASFTLHDLAHPYGKQLIPFAVLNLFISAAILGQAYTLSLVLTRAFLQGASLQDIQTQLVGFAVCSIVRGLLVWLAELKALRFAGVIKAEIRKRLLEHLARLGPAYTAAQRTGELVNTVSEGVDALEAYFSQFLPQTFRALLIPTGILIIVLLQDAASGLVLLLTAPLIPLFMILIGNLAEGITQKQWRTMSRLSAYFLDVLQGLTTLKIFNRAKDQVDTIRKISRQYRQTTMGVLRVAFLSALVLEMLATISTALVAVQIGVRLLSGNFDLQTAFFILFLAPEFYQPLRSLGSSFHTGTAGRAAASRIFEILGTEPMVVSETRSGSWEVEGGTAHLQGMPPVHFESVSFSYDQSNLPAVEDVSFTLQPGQITALIGPSGSGKTTITRLLLRFVSPYMGRILIGKTPLEEIDMETWRNRAAWVSQATHFFRGSIAENIRLGKPEASDLEVRQAAAMAQALDYIEALPEGFDTPIGEKGARLSGGQGQRIALARAFLKDADLVILDEPAANLDPQIEEELGPVFSQLAEEKTVLLISHRLHTILPADQLLVLQQGRLVENGAPETLQQVGGFYERLLAEARRAL